MSVLNIFTNKDGTIDPISFISSGRCKFCKKMIAGGISLMNYHIWKEHNEIHRKTIDIAYDKMSKDYKSRHSLEESKQMAEKYFLEIDKQQKDLI